MLRQLIQCRQVRSAQKGLVATAIHAISSTLTTLPLMRRDADYLVMPMAVSTATTLLPGNHETLMEPSPGNRADAACLRHSIQSSLLLRLRLRCCPRYG